MITHFFTSKKSYFKFFALLAHIFLLDNLIAQDNAVQLLPSGNACIGNTKTMSSTRSIVKILDLAKKAFNKNITKNTLKFGTTAFLFVAYFVMQLLIHECGHICAAKLFSPNLKSEIHLLAWPNDEPTDPLLKFGNIHIHKDGVLAYCRLLNYDVDDLTKYQNITQHVAGGAFNLIFTYIFLALKAACIKYKESKNLYSSFVFGLKNALTPYKNLFLKPQISNTEMICELGFIGWQLGFALTQLIYAFFPTFETGDGTRAWKEIWPNVPVPGEYVLPAAMLGIFLILMKKNVSTFNQHFKQRQTSH